MTFRGERRAPRTPCAPAGRSPRTLTLLLGARHRGVRRGACVAALCALLLVIGCRSAPPAELASPAASAATPTVTAPAAVATPAVATATVPPKPEPTRTREPPTAPATLEPTPTAEPPTATPLPAPPPPTPRAEPTPLAAVAPPKPAQPPAAKAAPATPTPRTAPATPTARELPPTPAPKPRAESASQPSGIGSRDPNAGAAPLSRTACPETHPIKGNQRSRSTQDWIYHERGSQSYNATAPERCFATAAEAEAAGYRAPRR